MIHIRRCYASLRIEIELRGIPSIAAEVFYIPMELITDNRELNEVYMAFRNRGHGDPDRLRMSITIGNRAAMRHLRALAFEVQAAQDNEFEHTRNQTQRIVRGSMLA